LNMYTTLVSGSSRGLGNAIAVKLRAAGHDVFTNSRHSLGSNNVQHLVFDSSIREEVISELSKLQESRHLDNLVCVVGTGSIREIDSDRQWELNFRENFFADVTLFEVAMNLFPNIKNVIFVSSVAGSKLLQDPPVEYSVAKAALNFYAKHMALKYAPQGTLINIIAPGNLLHDYSVWKKRIADAPQKTLDYIKTFVPTGELIEVDSVANTHMTGQILGIDGGQSI
jgi:3-oxoacyl-[acyl-carrier protein] reductase